MVSTDNTVKLAPGVTSVVKLVEGPVQEMVGTGLPCAVQLNVAWCDWFTVRSIGGPRMKGWAGWREGGEKVAGSESGRYTNVYYICVCVGGGYGKGIVYGCHKKVLDAQECEQLQVG